MKIIFSKKIKEKELWKNKDNNIINILLDYYKKGIFDNIKWKNLPANSRLIKIYTTSIYWEKRIVYMVDLVSKDAFFLFYRDKKDKIWENISIKNKYFKEKLDNYLNFLIEDIKNDNLDIYEM
jgi:hypothetical protein